MQKLISQECFYSKYSLKSRLHCGDTLNSQVMCKEFYSFEDKCIDATDLLLVIKILNLKFLWYFTLLTIVAIAINYKKSRNNLLLLIWENFEAV